MIHKEPFPHSQWGCCQHSLICCSVEPGLAYPHPQHSPTAGTFTQGQPRSTDSYHALRKNKKPYFTTKSDFSYRCAGIEGNWHCNSRLHSSFLLEGITQPTSACLAVPPIETLCSVISVNPCMALGSHRAAGIHKTAKTRRQVRNSVCHLRVSSQIFVCHCLKINLFESSSVSKQTG